MKECDMCFSTIDFLKDKNGRWYPVELDGTDHRKICSGILARHQDRVWNGENLVKIAVPKPKKAQRRCGHGRDKRWCVACRYGN